MVARRGARVVAFVPIALLAMPGGPALAHAIVEEVSPADGTLLASAPSELSRSLQRADQ